MRKKPRAMAENYKDLPASVKVYYDGWPGGCINMMIKFAQHATGGPLLHLKDVDNPRDFALLRRECIKLASQCPGYREDHHITLGMSYTADWGGKQYEEWWAEWAPYSCGYGAHKLPSYLQEEVPNG